MLNLCNWEDEIAARKRRRTDDVSADTQYLSSTVCQRLDRLADLQVPGYLKPPPEFQFPVRAQAAGSY